MVEKVFETVSAIRKSGVSVLIVEQLVQETLEIADRGYLIKAGRVEFEGLARDVLDTEDIRRAYLGL
jgi:branched-chain amino acid transport system ATP-binding protein